MEIVVHKVRELTGTQRSVAEELVGHALAEEQRLVIQVVDSNGPSLNEGNPPDELPLPERFNVYEGLTDEQIVTLEYAISRRLDLTRSGEVGTVIARGHAGRCRSAADDSD